MCYSYSLNKSSRFSVGFPRISRLGSAFIFLQCFKFADICIHETSLHMSDKQGINHNILIGNRFHVKLRIQIVEASCHHARSQVLRLEGAKYIFTGQDFCFYYMFKTNYSDHNKIWRHIKKLGWQCHE